VTQATGAVCVFVGSGSLWGARLMQTKGVDIHSLAVWGWEQQNNPVEFSFSKILHSDFGHSQL